MIIERTEHPSWLSNAYLVADSAGQRRPRRLNGINEPLIEAVEREGSRSPTCSSPPS